MKRVLLAVALAGLVWAFPRASDTAAFVPVASVSAVANAASVTTAGITTTSGDLVVCGLSAFGSVIGPTPVSDSLGNTWSAAIASQGTGESWGAIFYANSITAGAGHTFTFTATGSDFLAIACAEIHGAATSSVVGATNFSTASGTTHNSGNVTAGATAEMLVGVGANGRVAEGTPGVGMPLLPLVRIAGGVTQGISLSFRILDAGATAQYTYTTGASFNNFCGAALFKILPGGGGVGAEHSAVY